MTPAFLTGLDMLKQMQSLTGCCDTQPPVVVYRDRPARSFSIPEPGTPWWQTAKDCGAWADRKDGDVGYVHFGSVEALRVYTVKVTRQALAAAAPQAPQVAEPWQPIATAPKDGRKLIIAYRNRNNKARTVMASWLTDEQAAETDADGVGLEGGWYECIDNWPDYTEVAIHEGEPTHWQPLPAPPATPVA